MNKTSLILGLMGTMGLNLSGARGQEAAPRPADDCPTSTSCGVCQCDASGFNCETWCTTIDCNGTSTDDSVGC